MPWRGPEEPGEFATLGYLVAQWIEDNCVIPDGEHAGEKYILTDEMIRFLLWHYRIKSDAVLDIDKPSSAFFYRRSQLVRPQKWGKGPLSAAMICAEAEGPVLFAGWDAQGEPVGRPWATPWIQVTAVSEDQTDNVWRALKPMIELGPLVHVINDTGETRINLRGGGYIEPVTASARSRLGQRITFAVQDETHSWLKANGGYKLADNQRRNLAGMGGRSIETTNGWDPNEESVAQNTANFGGSDVHRDHRMPRKGSIKNRQQRQRMIREAYGDSWWVDQQRIEGEAVELLERDPAQAERFFCNLIVTGSDDAFDAERWRKKLAKPELVIAKGELIVIGFDGSRFDDATALIATDVVTGHQWPLGIWEQPAPELEWEVPEHEVTETLEAAFDTWEVWRLYADPPYWETSIDSWAGRWGDKRVIKWWTTRTKPMAWSLRSYHTAMTTGSISHNGDVRFAKHIANSKRKPHPQLRDDKGKPMWTIQKDRPGSPNKIDAAMAGCLSWEARGDAVSAAAKKTKRYRAASF